MATWASDEGIKLRVVPTEQHQTNGRVEVENRIIQDRMRAMLKRAKLPKTYWPWLLSEYCRNRNNIARQGKRATPYELFTGTRKGPVQTRKVALGVCFYPDPVKPVLASTGQTQNDRDV